MSLDIPNMGCHLILDFHGTNVDMNDYEGLNKNFTRIILESGATIEEVMHKSFEPQGVSILYLLSESHFSIHTWPEFGACAIDFYHCGETAKDRMIKAEQLLCDYLGWDNCTGSMIIDRGNYNYALVAQNETTSVLFKKHKLVKSYRNQKTSNYIDLERDEYSGECSKKLAMDSLISAGFHNISNLGTLISEENICNKNVISLSKSILEKDSNLEYRGSYVGTNKSNSSNTTSSKNSPRLETDRLSIELLEKASITNSEANKSNSKNLASFTSTKDNSSLKKESNSAQATHSYIDLNQIRKERNILVLGSGDLSFQCQIIKNGFADKITILDEDFYHKERLQALIRNNTEIESFISQNKIEFVLSQQEFLPETKFSGVIVLNKRHKFKFLKDLMIEGAFYWEFVINETEFEEICKFENFQKMSFSEVSNCITRFLIGKARYS